MKKVLIAIFVFCLPLHVYAEIWGVEREHYKGTGVWEDDLGQKGTLTISFVTEVRGVEENFWLSIKYGQVEKKIYASRIWDDGSPFNIFALDGYPIGDGSYSPCDWCRRQTELTTYDIRFSGWTLKLKRLTFPNSEALSGTITEENGRTVIWNYVDLEKHSPSS